MTCPPIVQVSSFYTLLIQLVSLVVALCVASYAMHRRGLPWARRSMQKSQEHMDLLELEKESLTQKQRDLDQEIIEQEALIEHLRKAADRWRVAYELQVRSSEERRYKLLHDAHERLKLQQVTLRAAYLRKLVVPQACEQTRSILQKKFSSPAQAHHFLSLVCAHIEQEVA